MSHPESNPQDAESNQDADAVSLSRERLELATRLGHPDAPQPSPEVALVVWSDSGEREQVIGQVASLLGETIPARVAADWAEHVLPLWEIEYPDDLRPHQAIAATRAWAACPCEEHGRAAADAATAARAAPEPRTRSGSVDPTDDDFSVSARAAMAAALTAATHDALAAESMEAEIAYEEALSGGATIDDAKALACALAFADTAAHVAEVAMTAARIAHPPGPDAADAEGEWQRLRLAAYVLGQV